MRKKREGILRNVRSMGDKVIVRCLVVFFVWRVFGLIFFLGFYLYKVEYRFR